MLTIDVELGNASPKLPEGESTDAPHVTYVHIPCDPENFPAAHHGYQQVQDSGLTGDDLTLHLADALVKRNGVTHLPGHEPVLVVADPNGAWNAHAKAGTAPTWVWSNTGEVERILAEFYGCPRGRPGDVEDTHHTTAGAPGVHPVVETAPGADFDLQAAITKTGRNIQARAFGGPAGVMGKTTTAPTSTTLTLTGQSAPGSTTAWNGMRVVASKTATAAWGLIKSNTTASPPVVTVDRWYAVATPGGAAASTPANTSVYAIMGGAGPAWFMGLSASSSTPGSPSTTVTLPTEITTATGGLVRQICPWAHTAGATTTTLTPVFTANTHDSLPVTVAKAAVFQSMVHGDTVATMFFIDKFGTSATISASGDTLTVTLTVTGT